MKLLRLTAIRDGKPVPVAINPAHVVSIIPGEKDEERTIIDMSNLGPDDGAIYVTQTYEQVCSLWEAVHNG